VLFGVRLAALLAHLGFKPKAKSSSPLKRTEELSTSAFQPILTGFAMGIEIYFGAGQSVGRNPPTGI
jgi:hypothetical protein